MNQQVFVDLTADQLRAARAAAVAHARAVALLKRNSGEGYHPPASRPPASKDRDPREGYQQPPPLAPAVHQIAARRITSDGETR